jgi:hypothetical protein
MNILTILLIGILLFSNCVYINYTDNTHIFASAESVKYDNHDNALIDFKMANGFSKCKYISRKPNHDSILILGKINKCKNNKSIKILSILCKDGIEDLNKYQYYSTDTSIFTIDTIMSTDCMKKQNICPYGIMKISIFNDGKAFLMAINNDDTIISDVIIRNKKLNNDLNGISCYSYSRKLFSNIKLEYNKFNGYDFKRWKDNINKKCK